MASYCKKLQLQLHVYRFRGSIERTTLVVVVIKVVQSCTCVLIRLVPSHLWRGTGPAYPAPPFHACCGDPDEPIKTQLHL